MLERRKRQPSCPTHGVQRRGHLPTIPFALISLFLWPANMAPQIQEPGSRLHLTEIMSVDGSRVGVDFVRIGGMEVAPECW